MKLILFYITLSLFPFSLTAQSDSNHINKFEICPNTFQNTRLDSSYTNFYISETTDTIYFKNLICVILPQLTSPSTTIWKTQEGNANGIV